MKILKGEIFKMTEKTFIEKLVKTIKERHNIKEYISDDIKDWSDELNTALNNADIISEDDNKISYNAYIEVRLFNKLINEYFTIEYNKIDDDLKYYL